MVGMELAETNTGLHRGPRTCASGASQTPFKDTGEAPGFRQTEKGEPGPQSCAQATPLNGDKDNEGRGRRIALVGDYSRHQCPRAPWSNRIGVLHLAYEVPYELYKGLHITLLNNFKKIVNKLMSPVSISIHVLTSITFKWQISILKASYPYLLCSQPRPLGP